MRKFRTWDEIFRHYCPKQWERERLVRMSPEERATELATKLTEQFRVALMEDK